MMLEDWRQQNNKLFKQYYFPFSIQKFSMDWSNQGLDYCFTDLQALERLCSENASPKNAKWALSALKGLNCWICSLEKVKKMLGKYLIGQRHLRRALFSWTNSTHSFRREGATQIQTKWWTELWRNCWCKWIKRPKTEFF